MSRLSDRTAIDVWEVGRTRRPLDRSLLLLAGADPTINHAELAALDVQTRDHRLIETRRDTFGDRLELYVACPGCATGLEFEVSAAALLAVEAEESRRVEADGWLVEFRLPTSADVAAAVRDGTDVFGACVTRAECDGDPTGEAEIPAEVRTAVEESMAEAAPAADLEFVSQCAECGVEASFPFDAGGYLWAEVAAHARRLVGEVAVLARAFGWSEADILAMGQLRRRSYLEMVS